MTRNLRFSLFLIIVFGFSSHLRAQTISTLAGTGTAGFSGDSSAATAAEINTPYGVAADAVGNVYFTDYGNNRIRRIDGTTGIITTIAGTGTAYFGGDGGPATAAHIQSPRGIALDYSGNIIFSDYGNNRIRKIDMTTGIITTLTGSSTPGFGGDGGPATAASVSYPWGVATDESGDVFIADQNNCRVRKINPSGIISTITGNGICYIRGDGGAATAAEVQYPLGVALDGSGNIFIADNGNNRVRKINSSGIISTIAGSPTYGFSGDGGPSTAAKLDYPQGIAVDDAGNVYICDMNNSRIRKINTSGIITTICGNGTASYGGDGGPATAAEINGITGVAVVASLGKVFIADNNNNRIRVINYLHIPIFDGGHTQYLTACYDGGAQNISGLLNVDDITIGATETWSLISGAFHGTAVAGYSTTSTGSTLYPTGLTYTPDTGYSGADTFVVEVYNGHYYDTTTIYVNILPLANAGIVTGIDTVCPGHNVTLSDTVSGGTWSITNTSIATISATGVLHGIVPGADTVKYTVINPCDTAIVTFPITVNSYSACHTGVPEINSGIGEGIAVSTNPNKGSFSVTVLSEFTEETHLSITNLQGQKVKEYTVTSNKAFGIESGLPAGNYFILANSKHNNFSSKMVITD